MESVTDGSRRAGVDAAGVGSARGEISIWWGVSRSRWAEVFYELRVEMEWASMILMATPFRLGYGFSFSSAASTSSRAHVERDDDRGLEAEPWLPRRVNPPFLLVATAKMVAS